MKVGVLEIEMLANMARLQKDMNDAKGMVGNAMTSITSAVSTAKTALAGLGIGIGVGALIGSLKQAIDAMAGMKDMAENAGISAEALSKFEQSARLAGMTLGDVSGSMIKFSKGLVAAQDPASDAARALQAFGLSAKDLKGLSLDQAFEKLARASDTYGGSAEKNVALMVLTGKSGSELQRLFGELASQQELAATVTNGQAEQADKLGDSFALLQMSGEKYRRQIASALLPSMQNMLDAFVALRGEKGEATGFFDAVGKAATFFAGIIGQVWITVRKAAEGIGALGAALGALLSGDFAGAKNIMGDFGASMENYVKDSVLLWANLYKVDSAQKAVAESGKKVLKYGPVLKESQQEFKNLLAVWKSVEEQRDEYEKGIGALNKQGDGLVANLKDGNLQLQLEADAIGKTNLERELMLLQLERERAIRTGSLDSVQLKSYDFYIKEREQLIRLRAQRQDDLEQQQQQIGMWNSLADAAGNFFGDLVMNGKSAFDRLRDSLKSFATDILAFFAKRYVLQMIAGASGTFGSTAASAASGALGAQGNTLMGTAMNAAGTWLGSTAIGTAASYFASGLTGTMVGSAAGMGATVAGSATGIGAIAGGSTAAGIGTTITSALAAIPVWGWIAIAAMAAYAAFGGKGGGPKTGGSFQGMFDTAGAQTGTNATNLFGLQPGESTGDSTVASIATATAKSYYELVKSFGGNSRALNFGLGYDSDPRGTADNRIKAQVTDAAGNSIFKEWDRAIGRDQDKIAPELQLSAYRALLAALQASDLPGEMGKLFGSILATTASQADIEALINTAKDLQYVMDGIADAGIPDVTIESLRALQAAGESLGQVFNRVVGEFLTAQNNLNAAIGSRNPQFARDLVLSQRNGLAAQFATLVGRDFGDALLSQMALQPETFTNLNTAGMNLLTNFLGLQSSLEQLDAQLAGSGATAVVNFTNALVTSTSAITDARGNLADYLNGSLLSPNSPLDPMQRYKEARQQYQTNLGLAQLDNVDAIANFGRYRDAFLSASSAIFASGSGYNADFFSTFNEGANLPNSGVRFYTAADGERHAEAIVEAVTTGSVKAGQQLALTAQLIDLIANGITVEDARVVQLLEDIKGIRSGGTVAATAGAL